MVIGDVVVANTGLEGQGPGEVLEGHVGDDPAGGDTRVLYSVVRVEEQHWLTWLPLVLSYLILLVVAGLVLDYLNGGPWW
jgi:hypothetical protein